MFAVRYVDGLIPFLACTDVFLGVQHYFEAVAFGGARKLNPADKAVLSEGYGALFVSLPDASSSSYQIRKSSRHSHGLKETEGSACQPRQPGISDRGPRVRARKRLSGLED